MHDIVLLCCVFSAAIWCMHHNSELHLRCNAHNVQDACQAQGCLMDVFLAIPYGMAVSAILSIVWQIHVHNAQCSFSSQSDCQAQKLKQVVHGPCTCDCITSSYIQGSCYIWQLSLQAAIGPQSEMTGWKGYLGEQRCKSPVLVR